MKNIFSKLPAVLLPWYYEHKRDLPWRQDKEPYHVWLSEIMLQQTRVEAVRGYYSRFLSSLPTVQDLAVCDDDKLHKLWEGLGYYSRVRNLKKAAQIIVSEYGGVFPREYEKILGLPGIGTYTAGAICSICYDAPTPAVDGNVLRVAARLTDDHTPIDLPAYKKQVQSALQQVYPHQGGDFTQALMELGATVCVPNGAPQCDICPCKAFCRSRMKGTVQQLPKKLPKRERKVEEKTVFIIRCDGRVALTKRPEGGLLAQMWQFPDVPYKLEMTDAVNAVERIGVKIKEIHKQVEKKHIFTHIEWRMRGIYLEAREESPGFVWFTEEEMEQSVALPTAYKQFWDAK